MANAKELRTLYHATPLSNLGSICCDGIKPGIDGIVYFCDSALDSLKFAMVHGVKEVLVCTCKLPAVDVFETFDHSEAFFKCKCYGVNHTVSPGDIVEYTKYVL